MLTSTNRYLPVLVTRVEHTGRMCVFDNGALEELRFIRASDDYKKAMFPSSLVRLTLRGDLDSLPPRMLPTSIKHLRLRNSSFVERLRDSVEDLVIECASNDILLDPERFPLSLARLVILNPYKIQIHNITATLPAAHTVEMNFEVNLRDHTSSLFSAATKKLVLDFGSFDQLRVSVGLVPSTVEVLHLLGKFNQQLSPGIIPDGVRELIIGLHFTNQLEIGSIPDSVETLTLASGVHQTLLPAMIPQSVKYLTLGCEVNEVYVPLCRELWPLGDHDDVQSVRGAFAYCLKPGDIPDSVTHLKLGGDFNQLLKVGVITNSITHLTLGGAYDMVFANDSLPASVTHLKLGAPWSNHVPDTVSHIFLSDRCTKEVLGHMLDTRARLYDDRAEPVHDVSGFEYDHDCFSLFYGDIEEDDDMYNESEDDEYEFGSADGYDDSDLFPYYSSDGDWN